MSTLVGLLRVLAIAYLGYALLLFFAQRGMVFPGARMALPTLPAVPDGVEALRLDTSAGSVEAWLVPAHGPQPAPALFFAHGNGELIDHWLGAMEGLAALGIHVVLVEYPGYGRSEGRPSRAGIAEVFVAAYDRVAARSDVDSSRMVFWGRSLGGGAVADLLRERPASAVILQSTFTSARRLAWQAFKAPGFLVRDPFDVATAVREWPGPLLLMHGHRDEVIPFEHGQALAALRADVELTVLDCGHNDCRWSETVQHVVRFLYANGLLTPAP